MMNQVAAKEQVKPIKIGDPDWNSVLAFYHYEAQLLDEVELTDWKELLAEDLDYKMPVRETVSRRDGLGFSDETFHFEDNHASMSLRIKRLTETRTAWAEDPPSRCRRFVTNLRVSRLDDDEFAARSYLLLMRNRRDETNFEFFSGERQDVLRRTADSFEIVKRTILCDQTRLGNNNLAIFF